MPKKNKKVLIVDDEEIIRKILRTELQKAGLETLEAFDAKSAYEIAIKEEPALILLDLRLPDEDGINVLKRLREHEWGCNVPVIILSNLSDEQKKNQAKQYGAKQYIVKADLSIGQLIDGIKSIVR